MGYIARIKTWIAGEILYAADLNAEFNNCIDSQIPEPASVARGDILYRGVTVWERLPAGTSGMFLKTMGSGANPLWDTPTPQVAIRDSYRNLVIKNNTTNPNYQVDIDIDEVILEDASNTLKRLLSVDLTVDITVSGANGLDTGSEQASTWYFVWVIGKEDGTKAGLLSTSSTSPTLPTGYTFKALVGVVRNSSGSNFETFHQRGKRVCFSPVTILGNGHETSYANIDLSTLVPPNAFVLHLNVDVSRAATDQCYLWVSPMNSSLGARKTMTQAGSGTTQIYENYSMGLITSQSLYYAVDNANTTANIYCVGWEY